MNDKPEPQPAITVNVNGPPTLHLPLTVQDILAAAEALRQFAMQVQVQAPPPPPPLQ